MAAARTQKRASASTGKTTARRGSASRVSSSRTSRAPRTAPARSAPSCKRAARRSVGRVRLTTAIITATVVLAAWSVYPVLRLQYQHQREVQSLETELADLKSRNDELRVQVDELKTPEGVELLARESLGLVKPGEQAYVVTGGTIAETSATIGPPVDAEVPLWQRALDALFGFD